MRILARTLYLLILLTSIGTLELHADTLSDGYISGEVTTQAGEQLSGVLVEAVNVDTGLVKQTVSDSRGAIRLPSLPPGSYSLRAQLEGFRDASLDGVTIRVGTGTNLRIAMEQEQPESTIEEIVVVESGISKIDLESSETTLTLSEVVIDALPLGRDSTSVAMLAPGAIKGDSYFGGGGLEYGTTPGFFAAFGGSSVAENAYYINGMNVTNFRNGLGGSTVPFEFFSEFQVKTAGISAEYGRATGGFINAVTKRGTNDFEYGFGAFYEPEGLRSESPDVSAADGTPSNLGSLESVTTSEAYAYAGGPIIEDKLFFFALVNPRDFDGSRASNVYQDSKADDLFWGAKIDYEINEQHSIEVTAFSDEQEFTSTTFNLDPVSKTILEDRGDTLFFRGGTHWILKYTGYLTDSFSIAGLVGESSADLNQSSGGDSFPVIFDNRAPEFFTNLGSWVSVFQSEDFDEREIVRLDLEWKSGRHLIRAGFDQESNHSFSEGRLSGDIYWAYFDAIPGESLPTGVVPPGATQVVQQILNTAGGSFDTKTRSWYIEDSWRVSDDLTLNLGVRNESFDNRNANGETFIKISDQWAPRLGAVWNIRGDGSAKLYASFGRYHLPVASNTNIRLGGSEFWSEEWFVLDGVNSDDTPQLGPQIGSALIFADGTIRDPDTLIDKSIEPMYQDEYTLGFATELRENYVAGINVIRRDLASTIEDITIDGALNDYAQANGFPGFSASGFDYYILTNPGTDVSVRIDLDFDGELESIDLTKEALVFPAAERKYSAVNLFLERAWDGDFFGRVDYTWSKSYGNYEGYTRSETGQADPGFSSNFDIPGLMDGTFGDLPNDRRHSIKVYGAWQFRPSWTLSANASWTSGEPRNVLSPHPTDFLASLYGPESFYTLDGELAPRGSVGETSSIKNLDLSLLYEREVFTSGNLSLQLDVFNVFDWDTVTAFREQTNYYAGPLDPRFGLPRSYQRPRYVRISARLDF